MIVSTCGFGSTGSSAVSDYLSEYNDVQVLDKLEFTWVYSVDGLIDLEYHIMHPHSRTGDSIMAIERYIERMYAIEDYYESKGLSKEEFHGSVTRLIEGITQCTWDWYSHNAHCRKGLRKKLLGILKNDIIPRIEIKKGKAITCFPMKKVHLSVAPKNFYELSKQHTMEILRGLGLKEDVRFTVLDQAFSGNNPQACFPFFENPYAIVVDRDPRDVYVFSKTKLIGRNHFMPTDTVDNFVKYYRAIREDQPYRNGNPRVLSMHFEDMVYDYQNTTKKIQEFLNLPDNPAPKTVFNPDISLPNTQVYKRFSQYTDDVRIIENELHEYLFDFEQYGDVRTDGEMFFGKSPLNRNK